MKQLIKLTESDLHSIVKQVINEAIEETDVVRLGKKSGLARKCQQAYDNGSIHKIRPNGSVESNNKRAMNSRVSSSELTQSFKELLGNNEPILYLNVMSFQEWLGQAVFQIEEIQQVDYDGIVMNGKYINQDDQTSVNMTLILRNDYSLKQPRQPKKIQYEIRRGNSPEGISNRKVLQTLVDFKVKYNYNRFISLA
jgi:hypothetical protein